MDSPHRDAIASGAGNAGFNACPGRRRATGRGRLRAGRPSPGTDAAGDSGPLKPTVTAWASGPARAGGSCGNRHRRMLCDSSVAFNFSVRLQRTSPGDSH